MGARRESLLRADSLLVEERLLGVSQERELAMHEQLFSARPSA